METEFECTGKLLDVRNLSMEIIQDGLVKPFIEQILTYTVFAVIVIVGLVANGLFLFVVYKVESMQTVMNAYLVNLAVADMIILGYGYIDRLYFYVSTPLNIGFDLFGPAYCVISTLFEVTYYVSVLTVTLFSMERYTAVCHPMRHIKISTFHRTLSLLAGTWLYSLILAALQIPSRGRRALYCILFPDDSEYRYLSGDTAYCTSFSPTYRNAIGVPLQLFPFYAALFGTAFFYAMIIWRLRNRREDIGGGKECDQATVAAKRALIAATRMIIINGCTFFLCNAPLQFFVTATWIFGLVGYQMKLPIAGRRNIFLVLTILLYLNSAVNPFIYGVTNPRYRNAFLKALSLDKKESKTRTDPSAATAMTSMVD
ncbi:putative cholecystokinin receptor type A-like [Apostichopus japonicus]|uniref:Putative cholecystokinin receptor type A-like n=1 Tax=Stichopus japonicus TaxID=307972 RepID=A0A2G8KPG8_STIJA|nr:putative cholecystokinin receptor type A-like [Apostichopus japonicus]